MSDIKTAMSAKDQAMSDKEQAMSPENDKNVSEQAMSKQLDTLVFPLYGQRLIEASAGTGKTFTIAILYLRLLLGHGGPDPDNSDNTDEPDNPGKSCAHPRPLTVDEILVVTFTEAATGELRDRIRKRIHEARIAFIRGVSNDPVISQLLAETDDHPTQAKILLAAERQMDEAAIFTIHGFCQRMLKQNAFESGSLFETEFITDEGKLRAQAVADFWRSEFYPLSKALASQIYDLWPGPDALMREIGPHLSNHELKINAHGQEQSIAERSSEIINAIDEVKRQWREVAADILATVSGSGVDKRSYSSRNLPKWVDEITDWANSDTVNNQLPKSLPKFSQNLLLEKTKKGEPPRMAVFDAVDTLLSSSVSLKDCVLYHAIIAVRQRMAAAKGRSQQRSFDDLLSGLDNALKGPSGELLAERIRQQFPLAMIDEFQDTDPQQYRIFSALYGNREETGLLMIGDPKQAIYGFRGADIFTYIQARRQVNDHYTLGKNWRSSQAMVSSVNYLFEQAEAPFIYEEDIKFDPVSAQGKDKQLVLDGETIPALNLWLYKNDNPVVNKAQYQHQLALATANQINLLLTGALNDKAMIGDTPVKAGDIAILVRTGREATLVRDALQQQGIASVYMSNRDSVFASQEAMDLFRILSACLSPQDERLLRAALATALFAKPATELDQLSENEHLWEQTVSQFRNYHQSWQRRGILPMLRLLLSEQQLAPLLLSQLGGERRLTDLLHLGELLQQASSELDGEHALLRWFGEHLELPDGNAEDQQLRLESDQNLVQIVTIHKSKGLEYNLVFLPFICSFRKTDSGLYHDEQQAILDLTGDERALELAEQERLAEDLRLLYVALTRAVYGCWLGMAPVKSGKATKAGTTDLHHSAIGYLLQGRDEADAAALETALNALQQGNEHIRICEPPLMNLPRYQPPVDEPVFAGRRFDKTIENNWWITSYSALSRHAGGSHDASHELPGFDLEVVDEAQVQLEQQQTIFTFPRGARPGTFMHTLFEEIDFPEAGGEALGEQITEMLELEGYEAHWQPVLEQLVADVLDCELAPGLSLRNLGERDKKVEMEFFLPIAHLNADDLNKLIKQHDPLSSEAGELAFEKLQGMLKGFIDLVFVHEGRYYVLDYKSNHLGDEAADYHIDALTGAMVDHRYDLQYQLYSLALHRFLRSRIPDYDYEQHFGGAYYLFLRGMSATAGHDYGVFHNKPSRALIDAMDQLFEGQQP